MNYREGDSGLEGPKEFFLMIIKRFCIYIVLPVILSTGLMWIEVPLMKEMVNPLQGLWAPFVEFTSWLILTSFGVVCVSHFLSQK